MRSEPCGRYALSDGTLCSTHHGRFEGGWQGPPRCTRWGLAAAPVTDAGLLASAMNEAFTYEDRDNGTPTLPFCDDVENFWEPFAAKVTAALSRQAEKETA